MSKVVEVEIHYLVRAHGAPIEVTSVVLMLTRDDGSQETREVVL